MICVCSIGNLLGENNHVRAHAASQAAFILALVCAGFLRYAGLPLFAD
jgi:hypothetical protein